MLSPPIGADGRCSCCGADASNTAGCARCASSITYCACGARVSCGCGAKFEHPSCPSLIATSTILFANMFDANVW
jgi:hypothetical protein